jgi:hypothetical protein
VRKLNLRLTGFKAKEGETKKKLVQRLNTKLLQGQMKLHAKVVTAMRQQHATVQASTSMTNVRPNTVMFKIATSENRQVVLQGAKAW